MLYICFKHAILYITGEMAGILLVLALAPPTVSFTKLVY